MESERSSEVTGDHFRKAVLAIQGGNIEDLRTIVSACGFEVNRASTMNADVGPDESVSAYSLLQIAIEDAKPDAVACLLAAGADPSGISQGLPPILIAADCVFEYERNFFQVDQDARDCLTHVCRAGGRENLSDEDRARLQQLLESYDAKLTDDGTLHWELG